MCQDILTHIPLTILQSVRRHLEVIHDFNTEVLRARDLERMVGSPGRYEWGYCLAHEAQAQASTAWLARFAAQVVTRGLEAQTVYTAMGKTPTLLPWSEAAHQWRTPSRDVGCAQWLWEAPAGARYPARSGERD